MADEITLDLNQTIAAAVNARIEAEVMKALSGDETIGRFVTSALRQTVEVKNSRSYQTEQVPFLTVVLRDAIQKATKAAVQTVIAEDIGLIEDEVRKALRRDIRRISETLASSLADAAAKTYGVDVHLDLKMPRNDG